MTKYTDKVSEASTQDHFSNIQLQINVGCHFRMLMIFLMVGIDCDGFVDKCPVEIER